MIDGHWIGFYRYGEGYPELDKLQTVPFSVTIKRGINQFVGRMTEEVAYGGIDDEIAIRGKLSGDEVEFTKYYTREHLIGDNDEIISLASANPTIVYYKGKYDEAESKFKGQWEITGLREDEQGTLQADNLSGYWEMWKE